MADVNTNIHIDIDTSQALTQLKNLQRQISQFHTSIARSSETAALAQRDLQKNFINSINSIGAFSAELRTIKTTAESFTTSLEKNKFAMREYFRYSMGATKSFGKFFKSEFDTVNKVAEENVKRLQTQYIKMGRDANGAMQAIAVMPKNLDLSNYSTQAQIAAQRQALFNQLVKQGTTNLLNFGKNTQWAGRQLMVGFTLPLMALGSTASRTFMDMEAAALKFKKVYGDLLTPATETKQALDNITQLGQQFTKYGIAVSQTVSLAADAAAAGFQGLDLQRQTTEATRLSVLGQIDSQKALQTTISLQNAFKMSSADLAGSIDFLNAVENQTVLSLDDVTTAIPKVAPVIQQLGGNVKDLAFFLTAMKEGGVNASEGANALKSGLASLINPSKKASDMLATMGINIKQIIESNKGDLKATVVSFARALDTLDPLTRARAIEQLFGKFQFARISTLLSNVTKQTGQAARVLDLAGTSAQDLAAVSEKELGITADSAMNKFKKTVEDLKLSLVPLGKTFLEAVTPIVKIVGGILDKFNGLSSGVKKAITILTIAIGAIGPVVLMTFGLLANSLANILKGANILRNGYLRLTGQSQLLTQQTDYLTVEQQNAAAVAHSLEQSHARLIQTFNVESGSLNQLAEAYMLASQAASRFAAANPGMMMPPGRRKFNEGTPKVNKYAGGVQIVPGSGNTDSVPAMLTPGEAVIPKKMTQKYGSLINGMIADNIPGYRKGLTAVGSQFAHITGRQETTMGDVLTGLESLPREIQQAKAGLIGLVRDVIDTFGANLKAFKYSGLGFSQSGELNRAMAQNRPVSASTFLQDFKSQGIQKWEASLKYANVSTSSVADELQTYDQKLQQSVQSIVDLNQNATITSSQFEAIEKEVRATLPEFSQLRQALNTAEATMTEFRFNPSQSQALQAGLTPYQVPSANDPSKMSAKRRVRLKSGREMRLGGEHALINVPGAFDVNEAIHEIKVAAGTASPSKKTIPIGEDIARGLEVGMQNQQAAVNEEAVKLADGAVASAQKAYKAKTESLVSVSGVKRENILAAQQTFNNLSKEEQDAILASRMGGRRRATRPQGAPPAVELNKIQEQYRVSEQTLEVEKKVIEQKKINNDRLVEMNNRLMSSSFAIGAIGSAISMFGSGPLADFSGIIAKVSTALFALMTVTQLLTQTKTLALIQERLSLASTAMKMAKGGGGIASMPGILGKTGIFGNIARLGFGISKLLGPIGLATTAITGLYLGFRLLQNQNEKARQKVEGLGNVAVLTGDKLKTLGDFFNVIPTKLPYESQGVRTIAGPQQRTQIQQLRENPAFIKAFKNDITAIKGASAGNLEMVLKSLGIQLKGRGFQQEQIQTIVKALQEEAGRTDVNLDFKTLGVTNDKQIAQQSAIIVEKFKSAFSKGKFTKGADIFGNAFNIGKWSTEAQAQMDAAGKSMFGVLQGMLAQFENGTLSSKQFTDQFAKLNSTINKMPEMAKLKIMSTMFAQMGPDAVKAVAGIKSVNDQLKVMIAMSVGKLQSEIDPKTGKEMNPILKAIQSDDPKTRSRGQAKLTEIVQGYFKAINDAVASESGKGNGEGTVANIFKDQLTALQDQIKTYDTLRKAKVDSATASEIAGNAEMANLIATGKLTKENLGYIKEYAAAKIKLANIEKAGSSVAEYENARLDTASKYLALQEKLIDIQNAPTLKKYNDQLEFQDQILQTIEQRIKLVNKKDILPRETLIKQNNYQLEKIAILEDEVNKKYDDQEKALSAIVEVNQQILNLQNSRMSIADALSKGDIGAAAQAMQEYKAQQQTFAQDRQTKALQDARKAEIDALGRVDLEKQNKQLQLQISDIQRTQLDAMDLAKTEVQDQIDLLNSQVTTLEKLIEKQKSSITYFGMTKEEISNASTFLQAMVDLNINPDDPGTVTAFLKAAKGDATSLNTLLGTTLPASAKAALTNLQSLRDGMNLSATITVATNKDGVVTDIATIQANWDTFKIKAAAAATNLIAQAQIKIDETSFTDFTTKMASMQTLIDDMTQAVLDIFKDNIITDDEAKAFAEKFGLTVENAKTMLKGLMDKWDGTTDSVKAAAEAYFNTVAKALTGKLDTTALEDFAKAWGIPTTSANAYFTGITDGVAAINLLDYSLPGSNAASGWLSAASAVSNYIELVKSATAAAAEQAAATAAASAAAKAQEEADIAKAEQDAAAAAEQAANAAAEDVVVPAPNTSGTLGSDYYSRYWKAKQKAGYSGGLMRPIALARGGFSNVGTDSVPAILTPGEFVMSKYAVSTYGADTMKAINDRSANIGDSVYNYNLSVNVKSDANPNEIANAVITQIKQIDGQRLRGNRL